MKKVFFLAVAFILAFAADAKPKKSDSELNLRVGSYNVWSVPAREWKLRKGGITETRGWDNCKKAVAELIVKLDCDIMGLQEMSIYNYEDLVKLIKKVGGKKYQIWWENINPVGHKHITGHAIIYNKKKLKLGEQKKLYLSPTPEEISKGWDEKRHYRAVLLTEVTHKKSGKKFYFMGTHGPLKKEANANAGRLLVEFDKNYNTENLPAIVVGDMNARPGQAFHNTMCGHFEDSFLVAEKKCGTIGTFNGSGESEKNFSIPNRRIDHIYVRSTEKGKFTVKNYKVNRDKFVMPDGQSHYPSDHNPVTVDLKLK